MFFYEDDEEMAEQIENTNCFSWNMKKSNKPSRKCLYFYAKHNMDDLDLWVENVDRSDW